MRRWYLSMPTEARWLIAVLASAAGFLLLTSIVNLGVALVDGLKQIDRHQARIARLMGYEALAPQLEQAALDAAVNLRQLAYPALDDANQSGAMFQQALRGFAEEAGLQVVGSQFLVLERERQQEEDSESGYFDQLAVDLSLEGSPLALDAFLLELKGHAPALATASMDIQRKKVTRRNIEEARGQLAVRVRVVALKELQ